MHTRARNLVWNKYPLVRHSAAYSSPKWTLFCLSMHRFSRLRGHLSRKTSSPRSLWDYNGEWKIRGISSDLSIVAIVSPSIIWSIRSSINRPKHHGRLNMRSYGSMQSLRNHMLRNSRARKRISMKCSKNARNKTADKTPQGSTKVLRNCRTKEKNDAFAFARNSSGSHMRKTYAALFLARFSNSVIKTHREGPKYFAITNSRAGYGVKEVYCRTGACTMAFFVDREFDMYLHCSCTCTSGKKSKHMSDHK